MMGFLAFLAGPWGSLIEKGLLIVSVAGLILVGVHQHDSSVAEKQQLKDQNTQLQRVVKDNNILNQKLDTLSNINKNILVELDTKNQKVEVVHDKVTQYITSPEAQKSNRPSSDIIKNTIGMLRNND